MTFMAKFLKTVLFFALPLTCIFRASYNSGHISEEWKLANVVPIFKKEDKASIEIYRPICLTCLFMKVFERLVKEKFLSVTVNFLVMSLNVNVLSNVLFFDFAEAFD